mmetsp:Transcript_643/g.2128  ORF Transcript_643/g.2128 Transcript_643/m.2128 type:complete len:291 (+) Transcript_643:960-1832(+)
MADEERMPRAAARVLQPLPAPDVRLSPRGLPRCVGAAQRHPPASEGGLPARPARRVQDSGLPGGEEHRRPLPAQCHHQTHGGARGVPGRCAGHYVRQRRRRACTRGADAHRHARAARDEGVPQEQCCEDCGQHVRARDVRQGPRALHPHAAAGAPQAHRRLLPRRPPDCRKGRGVARDGHGRPPHGGIPSRNHQNAGEDDHHRQGRGSPGCGQRLAGHGGNRGEESHRGRRKGGHGGVRKGVGHGAHPRGVCRSHPFLHPGMGVRLRSQGRRRHPLRGSGRLARRGSRGG